MSFSFVARTSRPQDIIMALYIQPYFVYHQSMNADADLRIARIASAIGEPARIRMLYCLMDGHARTATELAVIADVTPSTASAHLNRLQKERLIKVFVQGKHRYFSLEDLNVASALEALNVIAGGKKFLPNTPIGLREARTCYDHIAGALGVQLHNSLMKLGWLSVGSKEYELTQKGTKEIETLGIDLESVRAQRRRFAYACLDWSERQPHVGGALGAALLKIALKRKWVVQEFDSRALNVTNLGKREMQSRFDLQM
jgi:DNA-binding transcriptional ArsR family regulator